jgi:hypothetical protein
MIVSTEGSWYTSFLLWPKLLLLALIDPCFDFQSFRESLLAFSGNQPQTRHVRTHAWMLTEDETNELYWQEGLI